MPFVDLYPVNLDAEGSRETLEGVDEVVYRLVLTRLAAPGLPALVKVGDVEVHFVIGPVRTQVTASRQRPGFPFVFDKHMQRGVLVGENDLLTVAQLRQNMPSDVGRAMAEWRIRAETAIGFVVAMLDERIARQVVAEDVVFFRRGAAVAAADLHAQVRTFMPFDVTDEDRESLGQLGQQELSLERDASRAAHFYLSATRQGPTREGFLLLWLAVDALVGTRKTQKQAVASRLAEIGFDLDWVALPLGRLVGLRGNIAHGRIDDPELLRRGYYDTEAIARALIQTASGVSGGWPAMVGATAFPLPLGRRISEAERAWQEEWHEDALPVPDDTPAPAGLPRLDAVRGGHARWLSVEGADDETAKRLRFWAMAAVQAVGIDVDRVSVQVDRVGDLPVGIDMATNAEGVLVSASLADPETDTDEARLAYLLCRAIGEMHVMRIGIESAGWGAFLIELAGAWAGYREWVPGHEMPPELLHREPLDQASLQDLGAYVGIALAGDRERQEALDTWLQDSAVDADLRSLVGQTMDELSVASEYGEVLAFMKALAEETRRLADEP